MDINQLPDIQRRYDHQYWITSMHLQIPYRQFAEIAGLLRIRSRDEQGAG